MYYHYINNIYNFINRLLTLAVCLVLVISCQTEEPKTNTSSDDKELVDVSFYFLTGSFNNNATSEYYYNQSNTDDRINGPVVGVEQMEDILGIHPSPNMVEAELAYSLGYHIDKYVVGIYHKLEDGDEYELIENPNWQVPDNYGGRVEFKNNGQIIIYKGGTTIEIPNVRLYKGDEYKIVVWAQHDFSKDEDALKLIENTDVYADAIDGNWPYNTTNLDNVIVSYEYAINNDDKRDAFSTCEVFRPIENETRTIVLTRVFAQVNYFSYSSDWDRDVEGFFDVVTDEMSAFVVTDVPTLFNAVSQKVIEDDCESVADIAFNYSLTPGARSRNNKYINLNGANAHWISTSYILVPEEWTCTREWSKNGSNDHNYENHDNGLCIKFFWKYNKNGTVKYDYDHSDKMVGKPIPAKRNYRINIVWTAVTFNVSVSTDFFGEYNKGHNN